MPERLTWRKAGQSDQEFKDCLILAMLRSGVCVTQQNDRMEYLFIANLPDCWTVEPGVTPDDRTIFGEDLAERLAAVKGEVKESGERSRLEVMITGTRVFEFVVEQARARDGGRNIITTIIDMSEERRREKILRALLREVSHRSKNMLAIVHSIASQTARHSAGLDSFLTKFRGRLYSLSRSQELVTDSNWRGSHFHDLVRRQAERFLPPEADGIALSGDNVELSPNASLHIGLALHELIANATTHGRLLRGGPPVHLSLTSTKYNGSDAMEMTWTEDLDTRDERRAGTHGEDPDKQFGSAVLERVVPTAVDGTADYIIAPDQIVYRLTFRQA